MCMSSAVDVAVPSTHFIYSVGTHVVAALNILTSAAEHQMLCDLPLLKISSKNASNDMQLQDQYSRFLQGLTAANFE